MTTPPRTPAPDDTLTAPDLPADLDDAHMAQWVADNLPRRMVHAGGLGWHEWDGRRWLPRREEDAREAVRLTVIQLNKDALDAAATRDRLRSMTGLLSAGKITAITTLLKGVVSIQPCQFDQNPDLLNVGNGVVDLRTGDLLPHDPALLMTRLTETEYLPGATHPDWAQALVAMDEPVADWMQKRIGQAATGHPTSDDVLPVVQGGGSNGKSTVFESIESALGEHMVKVPTRLLLASPSDHPTELMSLRGARLAFLDETPEAGQLNVNRLKQILGQATMTSRAVRQDNVSWLATHSLFVMTNHIPNITETDHGTWRRLALVKFDKTFPRDDRFRTRMRAGRGGRREAVLAWIVAGAVGWYADGQVLPVAPKRVETDTRAWRHDADLVLAYATERLTFDPAAHVSTRSVYENFTDWLTDHGHHAWSEKLWATRFAGHEVTADHKVTKGKPRVHGRQFAAWMGVRFRAEGDDETGPGQGETDGVTGVMGRSDPPIENLFTGMFGTTRNTHHKPSPDPCRLHPDRPVPGCFTCDQKARAS